MRTKVRKLLMMQEKGDQEEKKKRSWEMPGLVKLTTLDRGKDQESQQCTDWATDCR
jgi:hypothetical protein